MMLQPGPKTLWLKGFPSEYHRVKLQLSAELGLQRIGGL